jgi:hypothetical protein
MKKSFTVTPKVLPKERVSVFHNGKWEDAIVNELWVRLVQDDEGRNIIMVHYDVQLCRKTKTGKPMNRTFSDREIIPEIVV